MEGSGRITVNNRDFTEYFEIHAQRFKVVTPLALTNTACEFDVSLRVYGGGNQGQSEACQLAVAKVGSANEALSHYDKAYLPILMKLNLLRHDHRLVERKKTGLYKARRKFTYKRR